jgi:RNA-directed DNA polymerase
MTVEQYIQEFSAKADLAGYSTENVNRFLAYAIPLLEKELPVIYNTAHLSALVGYNAVYITRAVVFTPFFYRTFLIKKHNGQNRQLAEPLPSLKEIQLWILENILYHIEPSKYAKAYIPGMGLKQNLVFHKDQRIVMNLDITDFFTNIRRGKVEQVFREAGYTSAISNLLAKLCCLFEYLPQGAPTSPYLSNLVMTNFDNIIGEYCKIHGIRFTRYADDLTFSGDFDPAEIYELVRIELAKYSLELNTAKTKVMGQGQRQTVTGIVVNQKLQVARYKRKAIRQEIFYIRKFGLQGHLNKLQNTRDGYLDHLKGLIQYVLFINPEDKEFVEYKSYINELINGASNNK